MFCSKCGTEAADTALFCTKCGAAVNQLSSVELPVQSPLPTEIKPCQENTSLVIWLTILSSALLLIGTRVLPFWLVSSKIPGIIDRGGVIFASDYSGIASIAFIIAFIVPILVLLKGKWRVMAAFVTLISGLLVIAGCFINYGPRMHTVSQSGQANYLTSVLLSQGIGVSVVNDWGFYLTLVSGIIYAIAGMGLFVNNAIVTSGITSEATLLIGKKSAWKVWLLVGILLLVLGGGSGIGWQILAKKDPTKISSNQSNGIYTEKSAASNEPEKPINNQPIETMNIPATLKNNQQSDTKVGQKKKNPTDNAEMLWVPGATFTMGSAADVGASSEYPAHQVTLTGYWIYQYDVTVAQYRAFCTDTGHALPKWPGDQYSWKDKTGWDDAALQQHPIVYVSWNDAKAYADWADVQLPTEAQWEYAACGPHENNYPWGGMATKDDRTNGWDNTKCANRDNSDNVGKSTWPVGSFPAGASWCGAQDMAGNVMQWCGDWYGDYTTTAITNPTGPGAGVRRVLRGGSWGDISYYDVGDYRSKYRRNNYPDGYFVGNVGFRCVSTVPGL